MGDADEQCRCERCGKALSAGVFPSRVGERRIVACGDCVLQIVREGKPAAGRDGQDG